MDPKAVVFHHRAFDDDGGVEAGEDFSAGNAGIDPVEGRDHLPAAHPNTIAPIPAQWMAPQHMMHGSVLVTSVLDARISDSSSALILETRPVSA